MRDVFSSADSHSPRPKETQFRQLEIPTIVELLVEYSHVGLAALVLGLAEFRRRRPKPCSIKITTKRGEARVELPPGEDLSPDQVMQLVNSLLHFGRDPAPPLDIRVEDKSPHAESA
jgi:hypothetical protein